LNRFVFVTDSHYYPDAPKDFGAPKMLTKGRELHKAVVPAINAVAPDFILHGGDFLCGGNSFDLPTDTFEQSIQEVQDLFEGFEAPFYCIPGNHDCDAQTWSFDAFNKAFNPPDILAVDDVSATLRIARANIFLGDTKQFGAGEWTDTHDDLLRAANAAAINDGKPIVLCLHTWVLPDSEVRPGEDGSGCVKGSGRLLSTVSECDAIVAVFTGHRHLNRISAYRDFLIVDSASLIGYPFGFREVTLSNDGWFSTRFHRIEIPEVMEAYRQRDDAGEDDRWQGQPHDCDCDILIPHLQKLRS
jgi:3',5'-cyclic AMP phosphodiesterase CpdA